MSYLKAHPEVNEVILSGGDPLMADDQALSVQVLLMMAVLMGLAGRS